MRRKVLTTALGFCLVAAACAPPAQAPPVSAQDIQEINKVMEALVAAVNQGDLAGFMALFTDDAALLPPNDAAQHGREAIRKWGEAQVQMFTLNVTFKPEVTAGRGDVAYQIGSYTINATPKAEGRAPLTDQGKEVLVFRKGQDGKWRVALDIWNSNTPLEDMLKAAQPAPTKPTS